MPGPISNQSSFQQIYQNFRKTDALFQGDKTLRSSGEQLYVSNKTHNLFPSDKKVAIRQAKYTAAYQAIKAALTREVGDANATKILQRVDAQIGNRSLRNGILRSDINRIHTQLQAVKQEGQLGVTSESLGDLFSGDIREEDSLSPRFIKDRHRTTYVMGNTTFDHDGEGSTQGLKALFSHLPPTDAKKMLAAVSLLANQETTKIAFHQFAQTLSMLPVVDHGTESSRYEISLQENGDVKLSVHCQAQFSSYIDMKTAQHVAIGEGSTYEFDLDITLKQNEILGGHPIAHIDSSHYGVLKQLE